LAVWQRQNDKVVKTASICTKGCNRPAKLPKTALPGSVSLCPGRNHRFFHGFRMNDDDFPTLPFCIFHGAGGTASAVSIIYGDNAVGMVDHIPVPGMEARASAIMGFTLLLYFTLPSPVTAKSIPL